ncbi:MAG: nucleoside deaminase [Phycisphaeraceae bacterium]|nr:nucleoside deaminase [Phycisphaeraceae bacterium]
MALNKADQALLDAAYEQAVKSYDEGGIPIGAAIADASGAIIAAGHNQREQSGDTTAHGEISAMRNAGRRRDWHECTMATTLSPCVMCTGALLLHRIPRVIIGESETFLGAEDRLIESGVELVRANDPRCVELMRRFIAERPEVWDEDIGIPPTA